MNAVGWLCLVSALAIAVGVTVAAIRTLVRAPRGKE